MKINKKYFHKIQTKIKISNVKSNKFILENEKFENIKSLK